MPTKKESKQENVPKDLEKEVRSLKKKLKAVKKERDFFKTCAMRFNTLLRQYEHYDDKAEEKRWNEILIKKKENQKKE